jgi:hypothetical protein
MYFYLYMSDTENITCEIDRSYVEETVTESEPVVEQVPEPVAEPVDEPVAESEPVVQEEVPSEPVPEPIAEPVAQEEVQSEPVPEPVAESEPVVQEELQPEPIAEPEPVVQEEVQPEPISEPVIEPLPEPVIETGDESLPEPVAESEPVIEIKSQYAMEPLPEPIAEKKNEVPRIIFIVPYRDREEQRKFFSLQMKTLLSDYSPNEYRIIYSHQADQRGFNRGAMKNLGFIYARSLYPADYKNITFVFNDVDIMPYTKNFLNYDTTVGKIKHFYGYTFTLGGIISVKGADFEKMNGFPNYWAWGYEDNALQNRAKLAEIEIDRSQFYPILDKNILQLKDGITRIVNRSQFDSYVDETKYNNNIDGVNTIYNISMSYDANTEFLNVTNFSTLIPEKPELNKVHDMRDGAVPFLRTAPQRRGRSSIIIMNKNLSFSFIFLFSFYFIPLFCVKKKQYFI